MYSPRGRVMPCHFAVVASRRFAVMVSADQRLLSVADYIQTGQSMQRRFKSSKSLDFHRFSLLPRWLQCCRVVFSSHARNIAAFGISCDLAVHFPFQHLTDLFSWTLSALSVEFSANIVCICCQKPEHNSPLTSSMSMLHTQVSWLATPKLSSICSLVMVLTDLFFHIFYIFVNFTIILFRFTSSAQFASFVTLLPNTHKVCLLHLQWPHELYQC